MQQVLLWFFHIVAVFWGTKFPFHAKSFQRKGYFKYVHAAMLITSIALPFVPVAVVQGTGKSTLSQIPAFLCTARSPEAFFYSFVLPASIILAAGMSLVVLIFQVIVHVTQTQTQRNGTHNDQVRFTIKYSNTQFINFCITQGFHCPIKAMWSKANLYIHQNSGELKVLTIFCYFSILTVILLTNTIPYDSS